MKPDDIFGIIVRTIGVLLLLLGLWYLTFGLAEAIGIVAGETPDEAKLLFVTATSAITIALFLIRAAHWIVRFSYPANAGIQKAPASATADNETDNP